MGLFCEEAGSEAGADFFLAQTVLVVVMWFWETRPDRSDLLMTRSIYLLSFYLFIYLFLWEMKADGTICVIMKVEGREYLCKAQ